MISPMEETTNQHITPEFAKAYVEAISRTRDVVADAENPFHKNSYATLGQHIAGTKAIFAQYGLAIVQFPVASGNSVGVETMVLHSSGGYISRKVTLPVAEGVKGQDVGSLVSYLRRYAIASVANLATSDDDAESDRASKAVTSGTGVFSKKSEERAINEAYAKRAEPAKPAEPAKVSSNPDLNVVIHFGKNKGKTLGELTQNSLDWYIKEFQPKPYKGVISPQDVALREALDRLSQGPQESAGGDDVPF
jgi:hypothetical protein